MMSTITRLQETRRIQTSAAPPVLIQRMGYYATREVDNITDLLAVEPPSRILETGCGAGIRTLELARRGYRMTGIDTTGWRIAAARGRATEPSLAATFYKRDARSFALLDSFDAAIASFVPGQENLDDRRILLNLSVSLRPGGRLLLDATAGAYTPSSIAKALIAAGFSKAEVFGSLDGMPYDNTARRLIAIATK
jgi:SAM-dependent methyltransferase